MKFNEAKKLMKVREQFKQELPKMTDIMLTTAKNFFSDSFRNQGFTNNSFEAWKKRKDKRDTYKRGRRTRGNSAPRSLKIGRGILIGKGSGILSRSLRKKRINIISGYIYSPVEYARVHNEGLRAGRGAGFKMPKRQFVGYSESLNRKIKARLEGRINQIFK